jgi:hypothetical protein
MCHYPCCMHFRSTQHILRALLFTALGTASTPLFQT